METRVSLVDLHSHILPGMDDGAQSDAEALEMLRIAASDGIQVIAATPHVNRTTSPDAILAGVARLNQLAVNEGVQIEVVPGSEVPIAADIVDRYHAGQVVTLNDTPYLLLELRQTADWPPYVQTAIYDLQVAGLVPILAHAERYPAIRDDAGVLTGLISSGVVIQINASSLLGKSGADSQRAAEELLRNRMAHIIASDAHRPHARAPRLQPALRHAATIVEASYVDGMRATAAAILRGQPVTLPEPLTPNHRSWAVKLWERLSGR